ncbi:MAG: PilC/PilY family type IV pilus protein [Rubrivivax sp.]
MKAKLQLAASAVALAGLLSGQASQATNVAELPLKASVLAKPNVVFGMDDSGSMDFAVLLNTNSGIVWWNGTSTFDGTTKQPLDYDGTYVPYVYTMPVGTATGGAIYSYDSYYGQAVPPTPQFAWVRSPKFNPLYYNSLVTYSAWPPAYVGGATVTYPDSTATAAKSHPATATSPTMNLTTQWDSGNANFSSNGYMFYVQAGMKVPSGSYVKATSATSSVCRSSGSWTTITTDLTVASGRACWAAIPYYPATFWNAESCTADDSSMTSSCVTAPDGTTTLKRYEIKAGNTFPSGRSYAAEMQNFANWFTYYRKRKLMLGASMGNVLENLTGLRMGVVPFNNNAAITMYDADAAAAASNRLSVIGKFYLNAMSSNGTPTHTTMKYIGDQYGSDTSIVQYACQRNAMFIVTDGFANDGTVSPPGYDSSKYGSNAAPYQTTSSGSQADIALSYYINQLRASGGSALAGGRVPASASTAPNADKNPNLHVNTYAITLGVKGDLWPSAVDPFVTAPTWTAPVADDPSMVDDLWHATINGRGQMYLATDAASTTTAIRNGLQDILSQTGAQGGVAVSTVNLSRGDGYAYLGVYNPSGWTGDLTANAINSTTGDINTTAAWSASSKLTARDWTTRVIASRNGAGPTAFTAAGVGSLVNPGGTWGTTADIVNYLRGDRSKEGTTFRSRTGLMGAVITSEPTIDRDNKVVYIASGEGMLHAFDITAGADAGKELWAFVPNAVLPDMGQTTARGYTFKTQLDGTPVVAKTGGTSRLLVAGMGAAGTNYYALDVSSPRALSESDLSWVKWQFPTGSSDSYATKVGQTVGKPVIVKTSAGYRVLVTSGYNSTYDGKGRLFVLDPATGSVLKEFATTAGALGAESGLAGVSGYLEDDGTVRYVYGGDLLGNLWRFDLDAASGTDPNLVAVLKGPTGTTQPVTAAPELAYIGGKRVVFVGTGRLLDITDFGNSAVQTFYAIADGATLANARSSLIQRTYTRATDTLSGATVDWSSSRGWYLDLSAGEQANTHPSVAYGSVAFTTNVTGATDCSASSYFYLIDFTTGGKSANADQVSTQLSSKANVSGVNAVLTSDGKVRGLMQTTDGEPIERTMSNRPTISPAKNSWREVRQE